MSSSEEKEVVLVDSFAPFVERLCRKLFDHELSKDDAMFKIRMEKKCVKYLVFSRILLIA